MSIGTPTGERCPRCNTPGVLVAGDGSCPGCLLELALGEPLDEISPEDSFTGDTCGNYQLGGILGRGGHGIVFLARRADSPKTYALKMLASATLAGPDELRRFRLEAESAMALDHPNIVRVLDVGEQNGIPFFVMEHAPGGSLADQQQASDTPETLRDLMRGHVSTLILVARAVHFAHERGVLHRDLKPANILLNEIGEPLVSDFGLARLLHAPSGVTMTGAALGTPAYMAPEQAAGSTLTIAADVYSLGAVLFHLLTGRPPFEGETPLETLRLVTSTDAPDPRKLAPWIDRDLAMICLTALRREVPRRYATAANLADDLERWSRGEPVAARPLNGLEKLVKTCRRHPIKATLALSLSLALASLAAVYVTGSILLREERNRAVRQGAIAKVNAAEATRARDESRLHSYAADMHIAFRAFDDGHLGQARRMLARQSPAAGLPDLRGFEWYALSRRCKGDDTQCWKDHQGAVMATAFSPDGQLLASGGRDGRLIVRKVPDGDIILSLPKADCPRGMAEIPLMTSVAGNSAELRKILLEGKLNPDEVRMRGRPSKLGEIATVAWSPDGTQFATAGLGSYVRIWKYPKGELYGIIPVITAVHLCFLPDEGGIAVFLDSDITPRQYELRIYHHDLSLAARVQGLQEAHAFSPDGRRIATLEKDRTRITLRDAATGAAMSTLEPSIQLKRLTFSHDASLLWGVEKNGTLAGCWRIRDGVRLGQIFPVSGKLDLLATFPDGERLAATGAGQALTVQHAKGATAASMMSGHEDVIRSLTVSSDGSWIATGGNDHSTRLWKDSGASQRPADDLNPRPPATSAPTIPEGHLVAASDHGMWVSDGRAGGSMRFLDHRGNELRKARAPSGPQERLVCTMDGRVVGAFSWPRGFRLLEDDGLHWSDMWKLSAGTVGPIVFSHDGQWLASGGDDNMITVRNVPDGKVIAELKGHRGSLVDLAFTPDGRSLASTADDGTLRLWHTATWRDLGILHHGEVLRKIHFSKDGSRLSAETASGALREFGRREE